MNQNVIMAQFQLAPNSLYSTEYKSLHSQSYHVQVYVHSLFKKVTKNGQIIYAENINSENLNNAFAFPFLNGI